MSILAYISDQIQPIYDKIIGKYIELMCFLICFSHLNKGCTFKKVNSEVNQFKPKILPYPYTLVQNLLHVSLFSTTSCMYSLLFSV